MSPSVRPAGRDGDASDRRNDRGPAHTPDRAQTTIDYAVGVSVFLLVVAFVFAFVPSLVGPFTGDDTSSVVVADRAADRLAGDLLVQTPTHPSALNTTCTVAFFETTGPDLTGVCRYDTDAGDLSGALGIESPATNLNVTVTDGASVLTIDGTQLAAGPSPARGNEVSAARRSVLVDERKRTLVVRVW